MKITSQQNSFTSGEWSPRSYGRFDLKYYGNAVKFLENFLINQLGGAGFKPGSRYVAATKFPAKKARLIPFQYSADLDYVIELGDEYMRFFENDADTITTTDWDGYTKLLLHGDGVDGSTTITDEIGNTVTAVGNAQIDTAQKKFGTGSILFDGTGDYLSVPHSTNWDFGNGDFTVDFGVRKVADGGSGYNYFIGQSGASGNAAWGIQHDNGKLNFYYTTDGTNTIDVGETWSMSNDTWYHIAVTREATGDGKIHLYVDGTELGTGTAISTTIFNSSAILDIGANAAGFFAGTLNGWIDEVRISKGIARWTANFTPPTSAYAKIASVLELSSPYLEDEIRAVHVAQNNDVMYMTHPNWQPRKLIRTSLTNFTLSLVSFVRGPFLDDNITTTTITPSAATGTGITLTASASLFDDLHIGALWRVKDGVVKITAVGSATSATADVQTEPDGTAGNLGGTSAYTDWAEGAFSDYRGWPATCGFHEQRLYYAQTAHEPNKFWGSVIQAYDNFDAGTAADDDAVSFAVAAEQRNEIRWMMSNNRSINLGTNGGTFSGPTGDSLPISPTNPPTLSKDTNYGVSVLPAKRISSYVYYVQRDLLKVRELSYSLDLDAIHSNDMTMLADHILETGVVDMDHQQSPNDRLWCVRTDGVMSVLTRNAEQEVMGWGRLIAGSDSRGPGAYESVCVIPKSGGEDQVWTIVKRYINGSYNRYIEYFTVENFDEDWDAVNVDCAVTMDNPITMTAATKANPVVITAASHGLSDGDQIKIDNVEGMTDLNGNTYLVAGSSTNSFHLHTLLGVNVNGSAYGTYISGGEVRKMVTAISGLSHLEGATVSVQADGLALSATYTVASGAITLAAKAAVVHVGLPYEGTIHLLQFSDGSATGTGQTKVRRIYLGTVRVYRSLGMKIGIDESNLDTVYFGATDDPSAQPTALVTGDIHKILDTGWDKEQELIIKQTESNPLNILALVILSEVEG